MLHLTVNGKTYPIDCPNDTPLLWVLRDTLGLKGTKYGCGVGRCGVCTLLVDGVPMASCSLPVGEVGAREVTTIEGLTATGHRVLDAWVEEQVPQCGYCQPAQILTAAALVDGNPDPDDRAIDEAMSPVLCRCGTYPRIRHAIHSAAARPSGSSAPVLPRPAHCDGDSIALDEWIRIAPDGTVTIVVNHTEMGQGVASALPALVAEELEVGLERVRTVFAPVDRRYRNPMFEDQLTGGSTSVRGEWRRLATAGAKARERLIEAAARHWGVEPSACSAGDGTVTHAPSERRLGYGELAQAAAGIKPPRRVALKSPDRYRLIGRPFKRLDMAELASGRVVYGTDMTVPDLRVAVVSRCPVIGATVDSFDDAEALRTPGVEGVYEIPTGVAVVARDTRSALEGRDRLNVNWSAGPHSTLDTDALFARLDQALGKRAEVRQRTGDAKRAFRQAACTVSAEYTTAMLAHATLEPPSCVARVGEDGCDLWIGTQCQEGARQTAARVAGLPIEKVSVHTLYAGGGFGRRLESDMVEEAVAIAVAAACPVRLVWTRADDLQHDRYRPVYRARLEAALDDIGQPVAWWQRYAGQLPVAMGCAALPYSIPHLRIEYNEVDLPVPAGAWRAVGAGQDAFAVESFIDELASAAKADPLAYRLALLDDAPRHRAVLERVAEAAGWSSASPPGVYRGIAIYRSSGSYVAQVAEVSVDDSKIRVHRVVCVIDCGRIVNPDTVRAQIEGSIAFGLSATLKEEITIAGGRIEQKDFEDYPILRLSQMPRVEVHIIDSLAAPGGVGEPALPPVAPAVANAVAAATGIRLRSLPLRLEGDRACGA